MQYVEHIEGDMDLMISVPHGGNLTPDDVPDRFCQCEDKSHPKCPIVTVSDDFTIDLAKTISNAIFEKLKKKPHIIINHLKRVKLDPNREMTFAAQNEQSCEAFEIYHGWIDTFKSKVKRGLLIDLHGRAKKDSITQIGYNIPSFMLIKGNFKVTESSIGTLAKEVPEINLINGKYSFGDFMNNEGYAAVPSPSLPKPNPNEVYFSGGYITKFHGNTNIDVIQLETPSDLRTESEEKMQKFGLALGAIISEYYQFHYHSG